MPSHHSELFPVHPPSLENHHATLHRHGRTLGSHTNQLVALHEQVKRLEQQSPIAELARIERQLIEKVNAVETELRIEVTRMRTAIYVAAVLIAGAGAGGKVLDVFRAPQPIDVQVIAPERKPQ